MSNIIKILAVGDPAVYAYSDEKLAILSEEIKKKIKFNIVNFENYYGKMIDSFEGKLNYDIVMVAGHLWLRDFVDKGYIASVENEYSEVYDYNDILEIIRNENKIEEKNYLYPSFCDGHILMYRKNVIKEATGIDKLPRVISIDNLLEVAKKIDGIDGKKAISLKAHPSEIFLDVLPYFRSEGVEVFKDEKGTIDFNNENGIKAVEKYQEMLLYSTENSLKNGNDGVREEFQKKQCHLAVTWGGQLGFVINENCQEREEIGYSIIDTAWNVTWGFAVNNKSSSKKEAFEVLEYLTTKDIDEKVGAYSGAPTRKSSYIKNMNKYSYYDKQLQSIEEFVKPLPQLLRAGEKMSVMYKYLSEILSGKITVKDGLKKAESEIKNL